MLLTCLLLIAVVATGGCQGKDDTYHTGPRDNDPAARTDVKLALNWFPEAEHGGFYAAQLNGYFAEEGLNVQIIPGGPGSPVIQQVARGTIEFGVATADQIPLGRAQGANVVATMAAIDQSPRCFLVHEESGINSLEELQDVTLAMNSGRAFSEYLKKHVPLKNVRVVPYDGSIAAFLRDKKFAQQAYEFSEPFLAKQEGANVRVLPIRAIGYNPYASLLFTSDKFKNDHPELVAKMTRACRKGWQAYLSEPAKTNEHLQSLNPELTPGVLEFGVQAIVPLTTVDQEDFGQMKLDRWKKLVEQLVDVGLIDQDAVKPEDCFFEAS
ncbi:ABC transporter substrate-binding protein [Bremerella sp. JC770]|uniref:ABC transporter substrate-binding protein n=1 Tax=Bremerella sp. JC770 TaxID=3232137 RepID=UPI00345827E3